MAETTGVFQSEWRSRGIGIVRIAFGLVWAADAWLKWQPGFLDQFTSFLTGAQQGQPAAIQSWIGMWVNLVQVNPELFSHMVAVTETAIAIGLLFGVFSQLTDLIGILLSLVIWSTAEGFGGPYGPGSTDVGAAIVYVLLFLGLFFSKAGLRFGLDRWLTPALGKWRFLASG